MKRRINFTFGLHSHQPIGNLDYVFDTAYKDAYLPLLEVIEKHPQIKMTLHYTGVLIDWFMDKYPEVLEKIKKLVDRGQIELMTGAYYEPILPIIPDRDKLGQLNRLTNFIKDYFDYTPRGMWLAERVWEPHLSKPVNEAGVEYLVVDDSHFRSVGLKDQDMLGYYLTEEQGYPLKIFPISKLLRYLIPFKPPERTIEYLESIADAEGDKLSTMADDGEKFGVWPGTHQTVFVEGWLEKFFTLLEENSDWIKVVTFSEYIDNYKPIGRIYLPTASYVEMMEWALPAESILRYEKLVEMVEDAGKMEEYGQFIRGGFWRNYLAKYPEGNNIHKKMLYVSDKVAKLVATEDEIIAKAQDELWKGQCNCAYWHGVFGGLYLNFLRYAVYHHLIRAEDVADRAFKDEDSWLEVSSFDIDYDGNEEIVVNNDLMNLYLAPAYGGSLLEWDYKPRAINVIDTIARRPEAYHQKIWELVESRKNEAQLSDEEAGEVKTIHEIVRVKEEGLENYLSYDWYRRVCFLDHFLHPDTDIDKFKRCSYGEQGDFVNQLYESEFKQEEETLIITLARRGQVWVEGVSIPIRIEKKFRINKGKSTIETDYTVANLSDSRVELWFGSEFNFSLLAGYADDRYYYLEGDELGEERNLASLGENKNVTLVGLRDEWLKVDISLRVDKPANLWRLPLETVSQSEGGFERVYQSSIVLPHWKFDLAPQEEWKVKLIAEVKSL